MGRERAPVLAALHCPGLTAHGRLARLPLIAVAAGCRSLLPLIRAADCRRCSLEQERSRWRRPRSGVIERGGDRVSGRRRTMAS